MDTALLIQSFASSFLDEIKNPYRATSNTKIITEILPVTIKESLLLDDTYKVYGSVGTGNWSEIPWLAVLDKAVTSSTTQGYYVVVLFDKSLKNIYLCLSVGWTQFEKEYGVQEGKANIQATCRYYAQALGTRPVGFSQGKIDLQAENNLGKGYEIGSIIAKRYAISQLSTVDFFEDMRRLIESYKELKSIVGDSILNLEVEIQINDREVSDFKKKIAQESFSDDIENSLEKLTEIANESPPEIRMQLRREIVRNRKFANYVKARVKFICQVCGRLPFIQKNGKPYAEADHINQLGGKMRGLDSPDNMRCLCAQCHSILTHGSEEEIDKLRIKK